MLEYRAQKNNIPDSPFYNPEAGPYLGRDTKLRKVYLPIKEGEANHIFILGKSGYGKTTFMKGLAEAIFDYYKTRGQKVLVIIIERKYDVTKFEKLKKWYFSLDKGTQEQLVYLKKYFQLAERYNDLGMPGDFAMSLPAYTFKQVYINEAGKDILTWHGLKPKAYPTTRIVFRPTRRLEAIKIDNGPLAQVVEGHIHYNAIDFETLARRMNISPNTRYGRLIEKFWDIELMRDPDAVIRAIENEYRRWGKETSPPDATLASVYSVLEPLKRDRLFVKNTEKDFTSYITADRINIIDFSQNSELNTKEERIIFKILVDFLVSKYVQRLKIPVFVFVDEIQDLVGTGNSAFHANPAMRAIEKLYRQGRSMNISLIASTQYMYRLPLNLIFGASHLCVVGRLASSKDASIIKELIPDSYKIKAIDEVESIEEYSKARKNGKFRGWFSFDKDFTLRMYFRPAQSY